MAYIHETHLGGVGFADHIVAALKSLSESVARYRLYRKTVSELSALSNHELEDLGLNRANLRSAAHTATYGYGAKS